jgi:hypothetical protein
MANFRMQGRTFDSPFFRHLLDVKETGDKQASDSSKHEESSKAESTSEEEQKFPFDFSAMSSILNVCTKNINTVRIYHFDIDSLQRIVMLETNDAVIECKTGEQSIYH